MNRERRAFFVRRVKGKLRRTLDEWLHPRRTRELRRQRGEAKARALALIAPLHAGGPRIARDCSCIIFSKDRPLQLDALVRSYKAMLQPLPPIALTYGASDARYRRAYEEVVRRHADVITYSEYREDAGFHDSLVRLVARATSDALFFLVDDNIFTRPVPLDELLAYDLRTHVPSLRMHEKLDWCYNHFTAQPVPPAHDDHALDAAHFVWRYAEGRYDWCYPLSLDGHLFDRAEIRAVVEHISFHSPNSLELGMQLFNDRFLPRYGVSFRAPVMINVPCNKIQKENDNPHAGSYHQSELLEVWERGLEIDTGTLRGFANTAAHQDVTFHFVPRL